MYPSPIKDTAQGRPVRMCPLILYSDDTSGNRSKKWNCFNVWCVQLASLPRSENAKLKNLIVICCSNAVKSELYYFVLHACMQSNCLFLTFLFAIAMQMFQPLKEELLNLERGVVMHDASIAKDVLVVAPVLLVKCDNPRASELLGHKGSSANRFCRICLVGTI